MQVGADVYFIGGDHDVPVFIAKWPGRRNDVWKYADRGRSWQLLGNAPWVPPTGHQCTGWRDKVLCLGGHVRGPEDAMAQYLAHDLWMWDPRDGMSGWQLVSNTAWGCPDDNASCGKSDFLMVIRDDILWTFGGDREVAAPWPQDNDVWRSDYRAGDRRSTSIAHTPGGSPRQRVRHHEIRHVAEPRDDALRVIHSASIKAIIS